MMSESVADPRAYPFRPDPQRGPHIRLYSGRAWHFLDPDPGAITLEDVAHHLSRKFRFAGALDVTVAQHGVAVSREAEKRARAALKPPHAAEAWVLRVALTALHHDDEEGPLFDVPAPMKASMTGWPIIERSNRNAIFAAFGVQHVGWDIVKAIDVRIREDEVRCCAAPAFRAAWVAESEPLGIAIEAWDPTRAKAAWLNRHRRLADALAAAREPKA